MTEWPAENNPGQGNILNISYVNQAGHSITEEFDLLEVLNEVLAEQEVKTSMQEGWIQLEDGLRLFPQFTNVECDERYRTSTTIETSSHLFLGLFEYQHNISEESLDDALREGFRTWCRMDLPVLRDALRDEPQDCPAMNMAFPTNSTHTEETPSRRRVLFGPVSHYATNPQALEKNTEEEHAFCPCCLFTNTVDAFRDLLQDEEVHMIRLYAARDGEGNPMADCRINGEDYALGHAALLKYVDTWSDQGLEFRKQLVMLQPLNES